MIPVRAPIKSQYALLVIVICIFIFRGQKVYVFGQLNATITNHNRLFRNWPNSIDKIALNDLVDNLQMLLRNESLEKSNLLQYLGDVYLMMGQRPIAVETWREGNVGGDLLVFRGLCAADKPEYESATMWFDLATEIDPESGYAWYQYGLYLIELGAFDEAVGSLQNATLNSNSDLFISSVYYEIGQLYQWEKTTENLQKAILAYENALALKRFEHPWQEVNSYVGVGVIQQEMGKLSEAEDSYRIALELNPNHYWANSRLGLILFTKAGLLEYPDFSEAAKYLTIATEIDPNIVAANRWLALLYQSEGHYDEASKYFLKVLELDPNNQDAIRFFKDQSR